MFEIAFKEESSICKNTIFFFFFENVEYAKQIAASNEKISPIINKIILPLSYVVLMIY